MDGIHDLGGKHGHGSVVREQNEPVFHARWEATVFSIMLAAGKAGAWHNSDRFRHLIERIDPISYLSDGYYGRWLGGIEAGLVEAGLLDSSSIQQRYIELGGSAEARVAAKPGAAYRPQVPDQAGSIRNVKKPKFQIGDLVMTGSDVKPGHTRLPAYARGKLGEIIACHKGWVYPDTNAHSEGEQPQNLYTVEFTGAELWGEGSEAMSLCLDLFEPYLNRVAEELT